MKAFIYNNQLYIRAIPGKSLFKSTMVHDVVNRGDVFAIRVEDSKLTIIPGKAEVYHLELNNAEIDLLALSKPIPVDVPGNTDSDPNCNLYM